ncbi:hypothetical protein AVEN_200521-1 [Araneus ventricosus]|uniref:Uncharacterized protein n=1 Tax=Araneus ventricosus TaxID=182803 RepID=A0A4Y2RQZ7_ARAVE|nr:hypothetical protein AVEN_200521-1 [Araneus ventricosus]
MLLCRPRQSDRCSKVRGRPKIAPELLPNGTWLTWSLQYNHLLCFFWDRYTLAAKKAMMEDLFWMRLAELTSETRNELISLIRVLRIGLC